MADGSGHVRLFTEDVDDLDLQAGADDIGAAAEPAVLGDLVVGLGLLLGRITRREALGAGEDLDLATLLGQIQDPPMRKLGVLDLDSFYPPKDRTALALKLNGLLASPSFASWNQGRDLDIDASPPPIVVSSA